MPIIGKHAIVNGEIVDAAQAVLPVQDKELQYGFGVYESLRVIQGRVIYVEDHISRLFYSAKGSRFTPLRILLNRLLLGYWSLLSMMR